MTGRRACAHARARTVQLKVGDPGSGPAAPGHAVRPPLTWQEVQDLLTDLAQPSTTTAAWAVHQFSMHQFSETLESGGTWPPWLLPKLAAAAAHGLQDSVLRLSGPRSVVLGRLEGKRGQGSSVLSEALAACVVVEGVVSRLGLVMQCSFDGNSRPSFRPTPAQLLRIAEETGEWVCRVTRQAHAAAGGSGAGMFERN